MMNTIGSLIGARKSGLFDCITYMAGISGNLSLPHTFQLLSSVTLPGSCWALGALYSGVAGDYTPESTAAHLMDRIQTSYLDKSALDMLTTFPTNKVRTISLLSGPCVSYYSIAETVFTLWYLTQGDCTIRRCIFNRRLWHSRIFAALCAFRSLTFRPSTSIITYV